MATSRRPRFFSRQPVRPSRVFPAPRSVNGRRRALTAAAKLIDMTDRQQVQEQRVFREGWQYEAWMYRQELPEARFAFNFLANCSRRMRLFPAFFPAKGESDDPLPLGEVPGFPPEVLASAERALSALGNGRLAIGSLLHKLSTNISVAGEAWLLGQNGPNGEELWKVRSVSEILVKDNKYVLRRVPQDSQGSIGWVELDPAETVLVRLWVPNPQYEDMADSPMKALGQTCEAIQILRRAIRASGRSRLTGAGLLALPLEVELHRPNNDDNDPQADDVLGSLAEAMMTAVETEGVASADVPIFLQGPGEHLDKIRHITFGTGYGKENLDALDYLQGLFAVGVDLPKSVVTGAVEELNHWSNWSVSADNFRHFIEPHVQTECDLLTAGFLRPAMLADDIDPEWVERVLFWYDPVDLIAPPDRSKTALDLHREFAISDQALRDANGYSESDRPSAEELQTRMFQHIRAFPPNLMMEWARENNPSLVVPPILTPGTVPGIKPGGVDVGAPAAPGDTSAAPGAPVGGQAALPSGPPAQGTEGPPPPPTAVDRLPPGVTAALEQLPALIEQLQASAAPKKVEAIRPSDESARMSRKLAAIDRDLRTRLRVAANQAMVLQLQRAGVRVKAAAHGRGGARTKNLAAIERLMGQPDVFVCAAVGQKLVEQMGLNASTLLGENWNALKEKFMYWVKEAQDGALAIAARLAGDPSEEALADAGEAMRKGRDAAWESLATGMSELAQSLLYRSDTMAEASGLSSVAPDAMVPTGLIRTALGVAGNAGVPTQAAQMWVGQVGTGSTVANLIQASGGMVHSYTWEHGNPINPFEPHEALDGVQFTSFTDDALANTYDFPENAYLFPGDHSGCGCDVTPNWMSPSDLAT